MIRLGVNVDHVATLREQRHTSYPSPVKVALLAQKAGADQITVHLREDRRHIKEKDVIELKKKLKIPLNLEMSLNKEIVEFALKVKPQSCCIVPERRRELTTEGGLDVIKNRKRLQKVIPELKKKGIKVSLFVEPDIRQIEEAKKLGSDAVEIHTGRYADAKTEKKRKKELERIKKAGEYAIKIGLKLHAGHGLHYGNTKPIAKIKGMEELNIGHAIISKAVEVGIEKAVKMMKKLMS